MPDYVKSLWYIKHYSLSSAILGPAILSTITVKRLAVEREVKQNFLKIK